MGQEDVILAAIYAVINMAISVLVGFILAKMEVLLPSTRKVVSDMNFKALLPIYGLYFIMQAIDKDKLKELVIILFSALSSVAMGLILCLVAGLFLRYDIRMKMSYTFVLIYANTIVMLQMLADSTCDKGGKYETTASCKSKLVKPYCALPLIYINTLYWITVLPILQNEKRIALEIKKIMAIVLNYYDTIDDFLQDSDFSKKKALKLEFAEVKAILDAEKKAQATPATVGTPAPTPAPTPPAEAGAASPTGQDKLKKEGEEKKEGDDKKEGEDKNIQTTSNMLPMPIKLSSDRFIHEFYGRTITNDYFEKMKTSFQQFEAKVYDGPSETENKKTILECILRPEKLEHPPKELSVCSWEFVREKILKSPPAVWSIIGLIIGFIFPLKEWIFDPNNKPLPTFLATLSTIGGMMSPISMFLLGSFLSQTAVVKPDLLIGWRHVIFSNILRNLMLPLLGLLWVCIFIKGMDEGMYKTNPVLMFITYAYWIVPNGILLIAVYVVAEYFSAEFAVISIYMNIIALPMMAIFLIIYFVVYES